MIVPMKRLTLIGLSADEEHILGALQSIGAVQFISQGEAAPGELLSQMENRVQRLKAALQIIKPFVPKSPSGTKPQMTREELTQNLPVAMSVCEKVETVDRQLSMAKSDIEKRGSLTDGKVREEELYAELKRLAKEQDILRLGLDAAMVERDLEACKTALGSTETTFLLDGWVREDEVEKLRQALHTVTDSYYLELADPQKKDVVPVALKNSKLVTPYEAVTNLYSLPAYGTVDGTPLMAFFYFIFFGMMLADSAYGIVLSLGCWLFIKKMKPQGTMLSMAKMLFQVGLSTIVMGLVVGAFAGLEWSTVFAGTFLEGVFPLINSSAEPISMLILCLGLGILHMFYGVLIATVRCIKQGNWMGAIVDHLCWLLIISGLIMQAAPIINLPPMVATVGKWMAIVCAAMVVLFSARAKGWSIGRFISGAGRLYDGTSWLSDVLSYSRIFALSLSNVVIGMVINTLGGMIYNGFQGNPVCQVIGFLLTAVVIVFLHFAMMLIGALSCFVHTARLQYVEFFGKFLRCRRKVFPTFEL